MAEESAADLFGYVKLDDKRQAHATQIRTKFSELADFVLTRLPEGRRKDLVRTWLETACMYAIKAISHG